MSERPSHEKPDRWRPSPPPAEITAMGRAFGLTRLRGVTFLAALLVAGFFLTPPPAPAQFPSNVPSTGTSGGHTGSHRNSPDLGDDSDVTGNPNQGLSPRQKQYIVHANFERSKSDAAELATLAKQLREELSKPGAKGLSLEALARIDRIEKLAKKIRDETKGF